MWMQFEQMQAHHRMAFMMQLLGTIALTGCVERSVWSTEKSSEWWQYIANQVRRTRNVIFKKTFCDIHSKAKIIFVILMLIMNKGV